MVSQPPKRAGDDKGSSSSGKGASNPSSSRPNPHGGISFVAFEAGISKDARKAVRVQAAKASAQARKNTIARKLAAQKQEEEDEAERAKKAVEPVKKSHPVKVKVEDNSGSRSSALAREPQINLLAPQAYPERQPVAATSPSSASSTSSRVLYDSDTDLSRPSCPNTPAVTHNTVGSTALEPRLRKPCNCRRCNQITPASSAATSPFSEIDFEPAVCDQQKTMSIISRYSVPRPETISPGRHDPFSCYPVQWQPWYDGLLRYMMTVFAPRAWPVLDITSAQGQRWEWFMTQHAMAEPALFYVRLLFASGDLIRVGALNRECSYWLQSQAIKVINEALADPRRSCSDGLILAVGRIALHECMYGDRAASNAIHRPAQRRMIDMRGGITSLGFPDLVKRLMRWADRVMSMQGATKRFLPDDEDEGNSTYGVKQSVDGFEAWAPETGQALRKKITIADLLTD